MKEYGDMFFEFSLVKRNGSKVYRISNKDRKIISDFDIGHVIFDRTCLLSPQENICGSTFAI